MTIFNYTVNYVDVGIVLLLVLTAYFGWRKGIALGVTNFIRYSGGMFLCFYMSNNFTQIVYDNYARQKCLEVINNEIVKSSNIDETINNLNSYVASLPDFVAKHLDVKSINLSSTDLAESILTNVFEPFVLIAIKVLIFIAVFIIFFGITGIILSVIKRHIRKKEKIEGGPSKLRTTDKAFGMVFGLFKGLIVVFAFATIVRYLADLDLEFVKVSGFMATAQKSVVLEYLAGISPFNAITEGLI